MGTDDFGDGWEWPSAEHDLTTQATNDRAYADIRWQRMQGQYGRIIGYRRAAEILFISLIESPTTSDLDTVIFPYAACWRHHLELQLKDVQQALWALRGEPPASANHHDIARLWSSVRDLLIAESPADTAEHVHVTRVVDQLASMDRNGQGFRYSRDVKGNLTLPDVDQIDFPTFHAALQSVSNYLNAVDSAIDHRLEIKRDMDAELAEETRSWY